MKTKKTVNIDGMTWGERELAQIVRRRMITRGPESKKKYNRKDKHKGSAGLKPADYFAKGKNDEIGGNLDQQLRCSCRAHL